MVPWVALTEPVKPAFCELNTTLLPDSEPVPVTETPPLLSTVNWPKLLIEPSLDKLGVLKVMVPAELAIVLVAGTVTED